MNTLEARKLATRIAKESSGVIVKFGRTNGRHCLHLCQSGKDAKYIMSETIYSVEEWNLHPWNFANRPKKKIQIDPDILNGVANKEAA